MKRLLLPALMFTLVFVSCGNDKKVKLETKNEDGSKTSTSFDPEKMKEGIGEMQKKMEELKNFTPLTLDQLKTLLPEDLNGVKRSDLKVSSTVGYGVAEAKYKKNDSSELKAMVYDCAGNAGSMFYMSMYQGAMNFQQETETEYTKTIDFKGGKAIENYRKDQNKSTLTYLSNDRLLVVLEGENMSPEDLKSAATNLSL